MLRLILSVFIVSFLCFCSNAQKPSGKGSKPVKEVVIDRFDQKTGTAVTGSNWYAISDQVNGGASEILPSDVRKAYVTIPERGNDQALHFTYEIHKKDFAWPYVTFGVPLTQEQMIGNIVFWKAIAYDFKGKGHAFNFQTSDVKDYAYFQKTIEGSEEWTTVIIPFTELKQPGWGKPVTFDASLIQGLAWAIQGRDGDKGEIYIDNVRFLKKSPAATEVKKKDTAPEVPSAGTISTSVKKVSLEGKADGKHSSLPDKVRIGDYYGFSKAAYSLSFDDGLISQCKYAAPLLNKYGVKGTFYILSGMLESDSAKQPAWRYGYWHQFASLARQGHEIGAHTVTHPRLTALADGSRTEAGTLEYELTAPLKTISERIPGIKVISFAYPMVDYNRHVMDEAARYYVSSRAGSNLPNGSDPEWMALRSYIIQYTGTRNLEEDLQKMQEVQQWISDRIISEGRWGILTAHDVLPVEEAGKAKDSWHPVSAESLEALLKWVSEEQRKKMLWVETVGNVSRYVREREAVKIKIAEESADRMVLELKDNLPDDVFNYPLSLEVEVPAAWRKAVVRQKSKETIVIVTEGKIRMDAVPDQGSVEILKAE